MSSYQSVGEVRNAYRCLLNWLMQCGTKGRCSFFCCISMWFLWIVVSCLCLIFDSTIHFIPCQSNNIWQVRQCRHLIMLWDWENVWFSVQQVMWNPFSVATKWTPTEWDITDLILEFVTHINWRIFLLRVRLETDSDTDAITDTDYTGEWHCTLLTCWKSDLDV